MTSPPAPDAVARVPRVPRGTVAWPSTALLAFGIMVLAWIQPVSYTDADGAMTLIVAQAILDHGAPYLEVYQDHPTLAYDLESDYRLRKRRGHIQLYDIGMPWLSVPAVAISRALGYDMLVIEHERALQNVLSAVCAGLIFVLIMSIARLPLPRGPSLLIALLWVLGSPLISTVATGLWSLDYSLVFMLIALREIVQVEVGLRARPRWWLVALVLLLAYACRPASGFMAVGVAAWAVARWRGPGRIRLLLAALASGLIVWALPDSVLPHYYDPERLKLVTPLGRGLVGVLLSPARGLLLFCPFLIVVAVGALAMGRRLWTTPLAALVLAWSLPHLFFVATKGVWWGGHCFGPRMLAELMLPALLVVLRLEREPWWRRPWVRAALIATGLAAIAIHTGSGLFNPATRQWNGRPNVDHSGRLLTHWRDPQFFANETALGARELFWQRQTLRPLHVGDRLLPDEDQAVFNDFGAPEVAGRWTIGPAASLEFAVGGLRPDDWYILELSLSTNGPQRVRATLDGRDFAPWKINGHGPQTVRQVLPGHILIAMPRAVLTFALPDARPTVNDTRQLGMLFRRMSVHALPSVSISAPATIPYDQDRWFLNGFSVAEAGWRWTDGPRADVLLAPPSHASRANVLSLTASSLGRQRVEVAARSPTGSERTVATWTFSGGAVQTFRVEVPQDALKVGAPTIITFDLPDARQVEGDSRQLGLAVREINLGDADDSS